MRYFSLLIVIVVVFVAAFAKSSNAKQQSNTDRDEKQIIVEFLKHFKEKRFLEATKLFSAELCFQCPETQLRKSLTEIEGSRIDRKNRTEAGELQSFDPPKCVRQPGGELWESTLNFENTKVLFRFAIDETQKIAALEIDSLGNLQSFWRDTCFNGSIFAERLGLVHSFAIEILDPDGNTFDPEPYERRYRSYPALLEKVDRLPEKDDPSYNNAEPWTDTKDGSHWVRFYRKSYGDGESSSYSWKDGVYHCTMLPPGTFRTALAMSPPENSELPGGVMLSEPFTLDDQQKTKRIKQKMVRGGYLKIRAIDVETGKPIHKGISIRELHCVNAPSSAIGGWQQYSGLPGAGPLVPGKCTFIVLIGTYKPDGLVYTPDQERYEAEIVDGRETMVDIKLRSRPQTEEELNNHWPFVIRGTVRDEAGNPLPGTTVTVRRSDIFVSGFWPSEETKSDSEGRFTLRFNPNALESRGGSSEVPTAEKPACMQIHLLLEKSGFLWKGICQDGKFSEGFSPFCITPKPTDLSKVRHYFHKNRELKPEEVLYPKEPLEIELVMQPSVHLNCTVLYDDPIVELEENSKGFRYYASLTVDLPSDPDPEKAKKQKTPSYYGKQTDEPDRQCFEIDILPQEANVFMNVPSPKWTEEQKIGGVVSNTDVFKLPPVGHYEVVLRWKTQEKHGVKLRQVYIDSAKDVEGNDVALETLRKTEVDDSLFNQWTIAGAVRDDLGNSMPDVEVKFFRYDNRKGHNFATVRTDAEGKYRVENIEPGYRDKNKPDVSGEFIAIQAEKDGYLQNEYVLKDKAYTVFLCDKDEAGAKPDEKTALPRKTTNCDITLTRLASLTGVLLDSNNKPLTGYPLRMATDLDIEWGLYPRMWTDRDGRFKTEKIPTGILLWFYYDNKAGEHDIFRTNNISFEPGVKNDFKLRLIILEDGSRRLVLESVADADGNDVTEKIVKEDPRTRPLLGSEETEKGRKIIEKVGDVTRAMFDITGNTVDTLSYTFHRPDAEQKVEIDSYNGEMNAEKLGITFRSPLQRIVENPPRVKFRAIETSENELHFSVAENRQYAYGNGISGTWSGYVSGGCGEAMLVVDAETFLPVRLEAGQVSEHYFDWVPIGNPGEGQKVPLRILCKAGNMEFDFRFKLHEPDVWLFDRSVKADGKTICHIGDVKIAKIVWASEVEENRVREVLKQYQKANEYWLSWYPKDLPKFGYTFHLRDEPDEVLSYEDIKAATNWYAELKRKGISYIGVSRLLVLDIDALRCRQIIEDKDAGTLEFDFVLKHDWMNAVGNGISGTWKGWFNGGVGKGTAVLDTKTGTLREIRTPNYDERYSDYFEIKPGQFVPRRIVVNYHKGGRDDAGKMFFDFRFKVYKPCLWLFDRSIDPEAKESVAWIDQVTVDGEPAVESNSPME